MPTDAERLMHHADRAERQAESIRDGGMLNRQVVADMLDDYARRLRQSGPGREPVAWRARYEGEEEWRFLGWPPSHDQYEEVQPLYAAPTDEAPEPLDGRAYLTEGHDGELPPVEEGERGEGEGAWEKCDRCGRRYPDVYWADDDQWEQVVGDTFGGLLCPECFKRGAWELGLEPTLTFLAPPLNAAPTLPLVAQCGEEAARLRGIADDPAYNLGLATRATLRRAADLLASPVARQGEGDELYFGSTPISEVSDSVLSVLLSGADPDELPAGAAELMHEAGRRLRYTPQGEGEAPRVVTLCGSSRFVDVMAVVAWELEKRGHIVHSLHLLPAWYGPEDDHQAEAEGVAEQMDELHLRKIDRSDEVLVIDLDGYIGESTSREIEYAERHKVPISYLSTREDLHDIRIPRQPEPTRDGGDDGD